jgi:hypothetical protein
VDGKVACAAVTALCLGLAGCSPPPFVTWQRVDGLPLELTRQQADALACEAIAQNAGAAIPLSPPAAPPVGAAVPPPAYSSNPYVVGQAPGPGSYQAPLVDFGGGMDAIATILQRSQLIRSTFMGCMAQRGYVPANKT